MRVVGLLSDDTACGYYRMIHPLQAMRDLGVETEWTLQPSQFIELAEQADVLILQRCAYPQIAEQVPRWRSQGKLVVYELDDLIHQIPPGNPSLAVYKPGSPALREATRIMSLCDGMIVSSQELLWFYWRYQPAIARIPNAIDFGMRDWDTPCYWPKVRPVVGWAGGSQHGPDVEEIARVFQIAVRLGYDIGVYTHFELARTLTQSIDPTRIVFIPTRPFRHYPYPLGMFDVGIAPIVNVAFNRAKCLHRTTRVFTPQGPRTIDSLSVGDRVWNGVTFVRVLAVHNEGRVPGIEVRLHNGLSIQLTEDHRVLSSIGWIFAGHLRVGDRIAIRAPFHVGEEGASRYVRAVRRGSKPFPVRMSQDAVVESVRTLLSKPLVVKSPYWAQAVAEWALSAGQPVQAEFDEDGVRITASDGSLTESAVVGIQPVWIDAIDIQVEGEVFVAGGVVSHNSALKPLEYAARGVPVVASWVGEYRWLHQEGADWLRLARTPTEWESHLESLRDYALRSELGARASAWVRERYDVRVVAARYLEMIDRFRQRKGLAPPPPRIDRNAPCPCGSGLKYKRCCAPAYTSS